MPKEIRIVFSDEEYRDLSALKKKLGLIWREVLRRGLNYQPPNAAEVET